MIHSTILIDVFKSSNCVFLEEPVFWRLWERTAANPVAEISSYSIMTIQFKIEPLAEIRVQADTHRFDFGTF